jgi:hypothetical protein
MEGNAVGYLTALYQLQWIICFEKYRMVAFGELKENAEQAVMLCFKLSPGPYLK